MGRDHSQLAESSNEYSDLVEQLTDAGPEDSRTILPTAQAEALVLRDLLGRSRDETAETLDLSVYTVDDRLRRARDNVDAVADLVRTLVDLDLVDVDLRLAPSAPAEIPTEDEDESEPDLWSRIMQIDEITKVVRSDDSVTVVADGIEGAEIETVIETLRDLGYTIWGEPERHGSGLTKIRGRIVEEDESDVESGSSETDDREDSDGDAGEQAESEPDEVRSEAEDALERGDPDAYRCHYCGDAFIVDEDTPEIVAQLAEDAHPACSGCMFTVVTGEDEIEPLDEFVEEDESDVESGSSETDGREDSDGDADEQGEQEHVCVDCGRSFDSGSALGGHRKYCPERDD